MNIEDAPTEILAQALVNRVDLVKPDGLVTPTIFALRLAIGALVCVDAVAVRRLDGEVQAMAICRKGGPYAGKLCWVGGIIAKQEHIQNAVQRHFRDDLALEVEMLTPWDRPLHIHQDMRPVNGAVLADFNPEPTKDHNIGLVYLVRIIAGAPRPGTTAYGQEASGVEWLSANNIPSDDAFAYGSGESFRACLAAAEKIL